MMLAFVIASLLGGVPPVQVECAAETEPLQVVGDAADDPAIWVDRVDPSRSLIIGTNKKAGLLVYDLTGRMVQSLADGRMNNVDVVQPSTGSALVFASNRSDNTIVVYRVDGDSRILVRIQDGTIPSGLEEVYGLCAAPNSTGDRCRVFVGSKSGLVREFEVWNLTGEMQFSMVREFAVGGQIEGMVVDSTHQALYVGEEQVGLWRYGLEVDADPPRRLVDAVSASGQGLSGNLAADVEGVTLYESAEGGGWIVVSCQGESRYAVYDRQTLVYRGSFSLSLSGADGGRDVVTHTDGVHATSAPLGHRFQSGMFVAQDDNDGIHQNFKFVDWSAIDRSLGLSAKPAEPAGR